MAMAKGERKNLMFERVLSDKRQVPGARGTRGPAAQSMRRRGRRVTTALAAALLFSMSVLPARADSSPPIPQTVTPPNESDLARSAMKDGVAASYVQLIKAGMPISDFDAQVEQLERNLTGGSLVPYGYTLTGQARQSGTAGTLSDYPAHSLGAAYQLQSTDYWCGPASGWIVMNWLGYGASAYNGNALNQTNLASGTWMNTTSGGTNLGDDPWRKTLNGWTSPTQSQAGWYIINWGPAASTISSDLAFDIDHYYVLIYDVHMSAAHGKLPGYSGYTEAWHYVAGNGYSNYGALTDWIDPFTGGSPGYNYAYDVNLLVPMMSDFGMIW